MYGISQVATDENYSKTFHSGKLFIFGCRELLWCNEEEIPDGEQTDGIGEHWFFSLVLKRCSGSSISDHVPKRESAFRYATLVVVLEATCLRN